MIKRLLQPKKLKGTQVVLETAPNIHAELTSEQLDTTLRYKEKHFYRLEMLLGISFSCLPEDYDKAEYRAKRLLLDEITKDVKPIVNQLCMAIYERDFNKAMELFEKLEKELIYIED